MKGQSAQEQAERLSNSSSCLERDTPASAEAKTQRGSDNFRGREEEEEEEEESRLCKSQVSCRFIGKLRFDMSQATELQRPKHSVIDVDL